MITVVTITYNNFDELRGTIESIPRNPEIDHLIINGGSCSKTLEYLNSSSFHHVSEKDKGIADAFNKGISLAKGDYIIFINSGDILIHFDYLLNAQMIFRNNPKIDFIYSSILFNHSTLGEYEYFPGMKIGDMPFPHPSLIVKKDIFSQTGPFSMNYKIAMDYEFAYKLKKLNKHGHYYKDGPVVKMDGGGVSSNKGLEGLNERIQILKNLKLFDLEAKRYLYRMWLKQYLKDFVIKMGISEEMIKKIKRLR